MERSLDAFWKVGVALDGIVTLGNGVERALEARDALGDQRALLDAVDGTKTLGVLCGRWNDLDNVERRRLGKAYGNEKHRWSQFNQSSG